MALAGILIRFQVILNGNDFLNLTQESVASINPESFWIPNSSNRTTSSHGASPLTGWPTIGPNPYGDLNNNETCFLHQTFDWIKCDTEQWLLVLMILKAIILGIIVLLTIAGNILVLVAIAFSPNLRSSTDMLILNLGFADLLLGIIVLPFSAFLQITQRWYFGQTFCTIWASIDVLLCTSSILSLCGISLDRYIGVTRPLAYSSIMIGRRTTILIIAIWVLAIAISIGPIFGWKEPSTGKEYECEINTQLGYVLFSCTGSFYLPMLIILFVYWKIYKAAIRQTKFLESGIKTTKQDQGQEVTLRVHLGGIYGGHYQPYNTNRANSTPDLSSIILKNPNGCQLHHHDNGCPVELQHLDLHRSHSQQHTSKNGRKKDKKVVSNPPVPPLAMPENSSITISAFNNNNGGGGNNRRESNGSIKGLRAHRGGGGRRRELIELTCIANVNRALEDQRKKNHKCKGGKSKICKKCPTSMNIADALKHQSHSQGGEYSASDMNCHLNGGGRNPNSLTPSPPSTSPERKLQMAAGGPNSAGFGRIAKFRRQKKAAKTLFCVVGAFLLCWFPFFFVLPLGALCEQCSPPKEVFDLFFWLGYLNSCLNPIIYACTQKKYSIAFRKILCGRPLATNCTPRLPRTNLGGYNVQNLNENSRRYNSPRLCTNHQNQQMSNWA